MVRFLYVFGCFGKAFPMRWRCFWPKVKFLFFKKVRAVFRALAKKNWCNFQKITESLIRSFLSFYQVVSKSWRALTNLRGKYDMDTLEHLERELEAILWICFSTRTIFWIFKENIFFQLFFVEIFLIDKNVPPYFTGTPL